MDKIIVFTPMIKLVTGFGMVMVTVVTAFLGKVMWSYTQNGRVEKATIYITSEAFVRAQKACDIGGLKNQMAKLHTDLETFKATTAVHQVETDKQLAANNSDIRTIREDMSEIKASQVRSIVLLETMAAGIKELKQVK